MRRTTILDSPSSPIVSPHNVLPWPDGVCKPLSSPPLTDAPSDGPKVIRWIEKNCRYGEGDRFGEPVKLELFQKIFLVWLFELKADGTRRYRRAMLEIPKGNGKTPISAWIGAYMLATQPSAVIPVAAASYEQADLLFGDLRNCVRESPTLSPLLDAFEGEIQVKNGPGRAYKVAAVAGTNDGQRPSTFLADEIHEWTGNKARVHLVIGNGAAKRAGSLVFNTTTPGADLDSMAGRMHQYGYKINAGEVEDDEFLFVHWGADPEAFDLEDPAQLRAAITAANPAADAFLNVSDVASRYYQIPRYEFIRYHLGQWTTVSETWLPPGAAEELVEDKQIPDGAEICLGFDGSFNGDCTSLVAVSIPRDDDKPHVQVVANYERPDNARADWKVPILDVEDMIREACRRWQVVEIVCDPFRWARTYQVLESEGLPIVEFPQTASRMTPATTSFYEAVVNKELTLDGDPALLRHLGNATLRVDARGTRVSKDHRNSTRKIDLAVAAIMAHARAQFNAQQAPAPRASFISFDDL